jgi:hypothetical protein
MNIQLHVYIFVYEFVYLYVRPGTGKIPVLEMALPFPELVPVLEMGDPVSSTEIALHFRCFLALVRFSHGCIYAQRSPHSPNKK